MIRTRLITVVHGKRRQINLAEGWTGPASLVGNACRKGGERLSFSISSMVRENRAHFQGLGRCSCRLDPGAESSSCATLRRLKQTVLSTAQGRGTHDGYLTLCCLKDVELPTKFSICVSFSSFFFVLPFF